ncbi:glycosyltransferase family 4 protein [Candidatus Woesearchaeota archaeon]|nr:glycosyltransferase family 4 protein [Candidatus Woesearchaeota archaeon]MBL7050646.1 glycosyltransferase family 4 protein [Candidatus Woesearchaeota archaeon]
MIQKKRLLIATDNFLPRWDGIARFLSQILPELTKEYSVTVVAPKFKGKFKKPKDVKLIRIKTHNFYLGDYQPSRPSFFALKKHIKDADLIWTQSIGPIGSSAIILSKLYKKPLIAYIHSIESELVSKSLGRGPVTKKLAFIITKWISRFLYNRCDLLMVPSLDTAEILSWQKIKSKKAVVHLGIDTLKFGPSLDKLGSKKKLGLPNSTIIGFTGRIGREKDLFTLYRAFLRIHKKHNVKLLIVGEGIQKIKEYLKTKSNVILTGPKDNVIDYLHAMDIYVMPSLTETSSLATMEAMATGLPVIATPIGHMKNYIDENYNGFHFPRRNHYTLSKKLEVLILDKKLRILVGNNARNTILENYLWGDTVKKIKKTFSIILGRD